MTTERDKLIEENLNLYYTFINQQKSKGFNQQLLEEINYRCMIGFINACEKYDKEHDSRAQFQTLAWQSMNNELINAINYNNRNKRKVNSYTDSLQEQEEKLAEDDNAPKNITPTEDFAYPDELTPILNEIEGLPDND